MKEGRKKPNHILFRLEFSFLPQAEQNTSLNLRSQALHGPYSTARMRLSVDFYAPKSYMQNQKKKPQILSQLHSIFHQTISNRMLLLP